MITQEEKVDQVRSVTLDCQWGTGERLHNNYYFGVKDKEATAQRKAYHAGGDFSYNLGYKLVYPINDRWEITQTSAYTRLGSDVAHSPIVESANQWLVGATVAYHF